MRKEIEKILKEYKAYKTGGLTHATNELLNLFIVSNSICKTDKYGSIKRVPKDEDNCAYCKYGDLRNSSNECMWCVENNTIYEYYC